MGSVLDVLITPEISCKCLSKETLETMNQFVEMFNKFLSLLESKDDAEHERNDIIHRARVMDEIAHY